MICLIILIVYLFNKGDEDVDEVVKPKTPEQRKKEAELNESKVFKEEMECLTSIDKDLMKKHYNNVIVKPNINININIMQRINIRKENGNYEKLISSYKKDKEHIDYEIAINFKNGVESKIELREISYENFPLMKVRNHYSMLINILNDKPIEKSEVLKRNIEEYHFELIKELNKFQKDVSNELQKDKARRKILEYLTNNNIDVFSDSLLRFNGLISENDLIFIHSNKIFCLEFISYPFDNSEITVRNNELILDNYSKRINPIVNERFFKQYFKDMDIINIFVICNETISINNENLTKTQLFIKYNQLPTLLERLKEDVFSNKDILPRILQEHCNYVYVNRGYKILALIQHLRESTDYYNYLYECLNSYKDIFELTQNMEIVYDKKKDKYYIRRKV